MICPATVTATMAPTSAGLPVPPEIVGVGSFVDAVAPPVIVTVGAVVSSVRACVASPGLPASSRTDAVTVRTPSVSESGVMFHDPFACASAVNVCPPTVTVTIEPVPTSVTPPTVGVTSFVERAAPPLMVTTGRIVSIVSD